MLDQAIEIPDISFRPLPLYPQMYPQQAFPQLLSLFANVWRPLSRPVLELCGCSINEFFCQKKIIAADPTASVIGRRPDACVFSGPALTLVKLTGAAPTRQSLAARTHCIVGTARRARLFSPRRPGRAASRAGLGRRPCRNYRRQRPASDALRRGRRRRSARTTRGLRLTPSH